MPRRRDVHARHGRHHTAVALVGDQADRAGVDDAEIRARDAHVRAEELAPESDPRDRRQFPRVVGVGTARRPTSRVRRPGA